MQERTRMLSSAFELGENLGRVSCDCEHATYGAGRATRLDGIHVESGREVCSLEL